MKIVQKITALSVSLALLLSLAGCQPKASTEGPSFDEFLTSLPSLLVEEDSLNLNYMFLHPENYGITPATLKLPLMTEEDYAASQKESEELLKRLESFSYDTLNDQQKLQYDVLKDSLTRSAYLCDYYLLDNSYLGSFIGYQAQLPLLLEQFTLSDADDLESYFSLLSSAQETFLSYAEIEKQRQEAKVGLPKSILELVVEQCENFSTRDVSFLVESMDGKIEGADFLSPEEKSAAKQKNKELVTQAFQPAYRALGEALSSIQPTNTEDQGLAFTPEGKAYYEKSLPGLTGLDLTPQEAKQYLQEKLASLQGQMMGLLLQSPSSLEALESGDYSYGDFASVQETLDYLSGAIGESYPPVGELRYQIHRVPDALKDNFSPAAYLTGKIDAPPDSQEQIFINGGYDPSLFTTIAHEGYPGHMYQHSYYRSQNPPAFRLMLDYLGYTEGWATYVEWNSWKLSPTEDQALLQLMSLNQQAVACIISLCDIGIHYEGWDRTQFKAFLDAQLGPDVLDEDSYREQYNLILETPVNYLCYYLTGFAFQDMYTAAEKELGDKFSPTAFHEVVLKTGPAPFSLLQQQVDRWVEAAKNA